MNIEYTEHLVVFADFICIDLKYSRSKRWIPIHTDDTISRNSLREILINYKRKGNEYRVY